MSTIVEHFEDVDADLRTVVALHGTTWEIEYMCDDVRAAYSDADLDAAYRSLMANQASSDDFDQLIEFGELEAQVYVFEEILAFQFHTSRYESLYVSYDREEPFPFFDVVDVAAAALDTD
ncbi:hypothetical protein [Halorientalis marina]|jgi:hypothetical protein|uniref:hypothetical protein n=1 Tax=Halorientalis marina TaxID=2931976 RepID=UPI001FF17844|nr:hypothetical protein [Halorientalis marina]